MASVVGKVAIAPKSLSTRVTLLSGTSPLLVTVPEMVTSAELPLRKATLQFFTTVRSGLTL
ncbi:hypothetical protein D3C80_2204880 [compost metagenome]